LLNGQYFPLEQREGDDILSEGQKLPAGQGVIANERNM
jgi:hypothetical protein